MISVWIAAAAVQSSDATLSELTLVNAADDAAITLTPSFVSGTEGYRASVASGVAQVTVAATTNHASATAVITPTDAESGTTGHQVNLTAGGDTVITVVVTAEDGSDKTYTVGVARAAAGGLTSLSVSPGRLSPPFDREQRSYRVEVGNAVTQVTIITEGPAGVQVQFTKINVVLPDADAVAAGHQVDLVVGDNVISVIAVGPSSVIKTYVVTVARAASDDATLSALTLVNAADDAAITLSPAFVSGTTHEGYTASVASGVATATVTATATHDEAEAVITPTDADSNTAGHQVNLTAGGTTEITVEVTAEDGATTKTYTVTVTRAAAGVSVVTLKLDPTTIDEDAGTAVNVTATLSAAKTTQFTVTVSAAAVFPATDAAYTLSANTTLTFAVNATESTGTVTITPVNNPDNERDKVITVSGAVAAGVTGVTGPADVTLTIEDDDHPVITHTLTLHENDAAKTLLDPAMIPEDAGQVCVRLTATTESDLRPEMDSGHTVASGRGTARSPGDYSGVSRSFFLPVSAYTLDSGQYVGFVDNCTELRILDDALDEDNEQFTLYVTPALNAPATYEFEYTINNRLTVTIIDDDPEPSLSIADADGAEGEDLEFTVTLDPASGREVTVDWAVDGDTATAGADYTDGSGTLTFAPGDTTKTVTVATLPDTVPEGDETFTVTLSNASNAAIGDADATGTIAANDAVLTALVLSGVTLVPPFDSAETEYTASVASTVENTAVTATPDPAGTAVVIKLGGTEDADATVSLAVGANVITVEVATGSTYTVTVTRAAAATTGFALHTDNADGWGLWGNADTFWVSDSNDDQIYAYDRSNGSRDSGKDIDATNATTTRGLWSDGAVMWVVDNRDDVGAKKLRPFSLAGVYDSASTVTLHSDHDHGRGAWSDGTTIWVSDEDDNKLYAYTLNGGARNAGAEFDLHADNADAQGIWSDDTTIWVVDSADDKVYAYALSDGTRQDGTGSTTDLEFALGGSNTDPRGLWSDGDTMYVVDSADDKIYDYILPRANNEATGEPTISGTNLVGQTQTANKGSIADADGVPAESTFTYQWIRVPPSRHRNRHYRGDLEDLHDRRCRRGPKLKVKVGFTDDAGNDESRTSAASAIIGYTSCTPAAPQGAIWSACLTVEHAGGSEYGYEFVNPTSTLNFGALSDTEFTVGGTTYTIDNIQVAGTTLVLGFTSAPGNAASDWTLHLSNVRQYALSAANQRGHGIPMGELRAVLE